MKPIPTIPGKSYSVHSTAGCTVSDDSGWSKTLEAPEDYFTAHRSKVYIDDDAATVRELFKLAPYQKLRLLGVVGGKKLPYGYTRLGYLEGTGTAYIDTGYYVLERDVIRFTSQYLPYTSLNDFEPYIIGNYSNSFQYILYTVSRSADSFNGWCVVRDFSARYWKNTGVTNYDKTDVEWSDKGLKENGKDITRFTPSSKLAPTGEIVSVALFARHMKDGSFASPCAKARIFRLRIDNAGDAKMKLVPALDSTGAPCMFDTVSKKPFYNSGSGAFIAGVETQTQLNNLLYKLPDRTGQEVGTLSVRLADALQTPENEAKLDAMLAKNWEISQAA